MMLIRFYICIIYLLLFTCMMQANLRFTPFPNRQLPSNEVRKLYQDSEGYIWIPTYNGLARYDGHNVVNYGFNNVTNKSFNSYLNAVVEDDEKGLWIAAENGVFKLNKMTGEVFSHTDSTLKNLNAVAIVFDSNKTLWVGGNKGLFRKKRGGDFEQLKLRDSVGNEILHINSIMEDSNHNLWITAWEQGLYRYDTKTGQLFSYIDPILKTAYVVYEDSRHTFWVGTWGRGLLKLSVPYTVHSMEYTQFLHNESMVTSLVDDIIYDINEDELSQLWIGGRSGLSILSLDGNKFENYTPDGNYGNLPYNEVNSILHTKDGLMWIGMLGGGICKVQSSQVKYEVDRLDYIKKKYKTNSVRSICQVGKNELWMGIMGRGLVKYNQRSQTGVNYVDVPELNHLPYPSTVNSIIKRRNKNEICFGTWCAGVFFYDEDKHKVTMLNQLVNEKLGDNCVYVLLEDSDNNLWIGTRNGLYIFDTTNELYTLSEWLHCAEVPPLSSVYDIKEDEMHNLWLALGEEGVMRIDLNQKSYKKYTISGKHSSYVTSCILIDSQQRIWVGTMWSGLVYYQAASDSFITFPAISNIENTSISNIIEDENKYIWITSNNIVLAFSVDDSFRIQKVNYYATYDDVSGSLFNRNASCVLPEGKIAFGSLQGLYIFETQQMYDDDMSSFPLLFTDFKIHNRSLRDFTKEEREKFSKYEINYADRITIPYNQNNLTIEFSFMNYERRDDYLYAFKLEGYDERENIVDSQHHFAIYNNLPAGTYTFCLKGMLPNGEWSNEVKTLTIVIQPKPWQSWGAYVIYILLFVLIFYSIFYFLHYRMRMQHLIQISELEQQKIQEINHLKLQFFTNITHELMTPLSIILASLESLKNGSDKQSLLSVMTVNVTRLMRLIQQVLEFRKVESGNLKICVSYGEVSLFVRSCVEAFIPLLGKKQQHIVFTSEPESILGYFDSDKLDKMIYNLLSNAIKYTPVEGRISVNLKKSSVDDMLQIDVINTGELMNRKTIDNLFKRFYEGDYRKHNTIGTGIGLSLVKDLVNIHHGTIEAFSNQSIGNCFRILLPLDKESYVQGEIDEELGAQMQTSFTMPVYIDETIENAGDEMLQADYTILIVDDNEELCMLLSNLLSNYFCVKIAMNGKQAIQVLEEGNINLVVSDIMMPDMDGIELCKYIKQQFEFSHIPVILLTAKRTEKSQIEGYSSGADGYISKPCNISLLYAQIINCLKRQERKSTDFRKQVVFEVNKLEYTSIDEAFLQKVIDCVNAHLSDTDFSLEKFVFEVGTSRTVLTEKLKTLTGLTPSNFILNVRLTTACKLMEEQRKVRISDLAYAVGFNNPNYFSMCFKKKYGLSPKEYISNKLTPEG